ncbi:PDR/VanB family oxidoreductase [Massilia sp. CF038]|uniref:PDR/VanB family oxidoreductase n=1 Tax=Massilia sp. CF038 TaxID=1881045 RepID=UPI000913F888|nr:PDR/VanB family oxidoreductase [Massilia sp. CF038]SHG65073.1 vanillate O-demethylase ferredoxin subunit [Massilia sp. CF038]
MKLIVRQIVAHGEAVRELRLQRADGAALPAWSAGAHIKLALPLAAQGPVERRYSLVGAPGDTSTYRIAVLREPLGKGSAWLHENVSEGDAIEVDGPYTSFSPRAGAGRALLIAGGIGVTPLVSIAHALASQGVPCRCHYLVSERARAVLLAELETIGAVDVNLHVSGEQGGRADLGAILGPYSAGDVVYACGPAPMLAALRASAAALGWPAASVVIESFGARSNAQDEALTVHLAQSELTLSVAPGTTILDALIAADVFVAWDCKRGECGNCFTQVSEGIPIHRDVCLTPVQQQVGMCTCVSWAGGGRLVLDL